MQPKYVDFHTHLDLYPDLATVIADCHQNKIATLAVTTTPKAFSRNYDLASYSDFVQVGLGLHPQLVKDRADEISLFEKLLPLSKYVGEVGLDAGPHHFRSLRLQTSIFEHILRLCAEEGGKILSVHSVRAASLVLELLEKHLPPDRATIVLHWFSGPLNDVRRALAFGCFFSLNEQMLASSNGRRILREIPDDRLLTETDGPFVLRDGLPISAGDVLCAVQQIASLKQRSFEEVRSQIIQNFQALTRQHEYPPE